MKNSEKMMEMAWLQTWLNVSIVTLNITLQFLVIYGLLQIGSFLFLNLAIMYKWFQLYSWCLFCNDLIIINFTCCLLINLEI